MRTVPVIPLAIALAALLAGCGPAPEATPAPTGTSTSMSSPDATDVAELPVTRLRIQTDVVQFGDELGWSADEFAYDDPHDSTIAKLTAAFGVDPTEQRWDGVDGSATFSYDWGGFQLYFSTGGGLPETMGVQVTTGEIGGVTIEVGDGVRVGSPWADAVAGADRVETVEADAPVVEARFDVETLSANESRFIAVYGEDVGTVTQITGPLTEGRM